MREEYRILEKKTSREKEIDYKRKGKPEKRKYMNSEGQGFHLKIKKICFLNFHFQKITFR